MKLYERLRLLLEPFVQSHYHFVRKRLRQIAPSFSARPKVLDVGGRESPYTLGIDADIVLSELPREKDIQHDLYLGLTPEIIETLLKRRSNISEIIIDDMTQSQFAENSFDCILAVEVLEHVEEDAKFLSEVHRVLKPGGIFLMTTPNGDHIPNTNPDHKRHYKRSELEQLLSDKFIGVDVVYSVRTGQLLNLGWVRRFSYKRPFITMVGGLANALNLVRSLPRSTKQNIHTAHLIAMARKDTVANN